MKRLWIPLILCLLFGGVVAAQDGMDATLIATFNGDMYRLEGDALVEYTACTPDEEISMQFVSSPDGTKFAFATLPKIISAAIGEFGGLGDMPVGLNLWLCDTTTDALIRFEAMEGSDMPFDGELPDASPIHSVPEFSPDGSQIVWTSVSPDGMDYRLWMYDIATGETTNSQLELPPPFMFPIPPMIFWGDTGLYMNMTVFNEETFVSEDTLYSYDFETGTFSNTVVMLSEGETSDFITDRFMLSGTDDEMFAIHLFEGGWQVVNPETGEQTSMNGVPLAFGSEDGVSAITDTDENFNFNWQIVGTEPPFVLESYPLQRVAFSPDGTQFAYADSTLHIWSDGDIMDISNSDGFADDVSAQVIWGQKHWAMAEMEVADAPLPTCDGTLPSQLREGDIGSVISNSLPNRLRDNPGIGATQIGTVPPSGRFTVLEGPVCADGYSWYRVQTGDTQGWTAEASADAYFVQPTGE